MGVISWDQLSWDQLSQDQFSRDQLKFSWDQLLHTIIANHKLSSLESPMKLLQLWGATYQQPYWRVAFKVEKVVGGPHSNIWRLQEGRSEHKDENADAEPGAQQAPRRRWVRPKERQIQNLFARFNSKAMSLNDWNITQSFVIRLYICMFATLLI